MFKNDACSIFGPGYVPVCHAFAPLSCSLQGSRDGVLTERLVADDFAALLNTDVLRCIADDWNGSAHELLESYADSCFSG